MTYMEEEYDYMSLMHFTPNEYQTADATVQEGFNTLYLSF